VGWQAIREARHGRQLDRGLLDGETASLSARFNEKKSWESNRTRRWDARAMACHAALIDRIDQGMGKILAKLKELGLFENTLILLLSDNGASREEPSRPGFDRVSRTRDGQKVTYYGGGKPKEILPGPETTYAGIGPDWANATNTPFRLFKATQYEGGIRTPLIAHWPKGLQVKPGSITGQPGHVIDILATCIDLARARYPVQFRGHKIIPLEGKSLVPVLKGRKREGHEALFFEHFGERAIRQGDWKLVAPRGRGWELYHLARDQSETRDLAGQHPERVQSLSELWNRWARRASVLPAPGR